MSIFPEQYMRNRNTLADLVFARGCKIGVEIGTWLGAYAATLLERTALQRLICVDSWDGTGMSVEFDGDGIYNDCRASLKRFGRRVDLWRVKSLIAAESPEIKLINIDFVYIDANHSYEAAKADILAWIPRIKKGGIMAGHDYNNRGKKGVKRAVDEIFGGRVDSTQERCASWVTVIV